MFFLTRRHGVAGGIDVVGLVIVAPGLVGDVVNKGDSFT